MAVVIETNTTAPRAEVTVEDVKRELDEILYELLPAYPSIRSQVIVGDPPQITYLLARKAREKPEK